MTDPIKAHRYASKASFRVMGCKDNVQCAVWLVLTNVCSVRVATKAFNVDKNVMMHAHKTILAT